MAKLVFYTQVREDGGIRTGIEIDELTYFEEFQSSGDEHDPALVWYVDVRCEGKGLPNQATKARDWLLAHGGTIKKGIMKLADDLRAGIDVESYPLRRKLTDPPKGVQITVVCSAARRLAALNIAQELITLVQRWEKTILRLPATHAATS